jgi:hypothetical protein
MTIDSLTNDGRLLLKVSSTRARINWTNCEPDPVMLSPYWSINITGHRINEVQKTTAKKFQSFIRVRESFYYFTDIGNVLILE